MELIPEQNPRVIMHGAMRNGMRVKFRYLPERERVGEFKIIGWYPFAHAFFQNGDPELWKSNGHWREDDKESEFDIVQLIGAEKEIAIT